MTLTEQEVLQALMKARTRVSAAAWLVVRDTHAAEDIFQNVAVKAMTRDVTFDNESALLSWALITARREGIDWLRRHKREACGLDAGILDLLEREWQSHPVQPAGARIEALHSLNWSTICLSTGGAPTIKSSASNTAKGSLPTRRWPHSTAWPRPSACAWRT